MNYEKTNWVKGDVITAAKLNNIESGVEMLNKIWKPSIIAELTYEGDETGNYVGQIQRNLNIANLVALWVSIEGVYYKVEEIRFNELDTSEINLTVNQQYSITYDTSSGKLTGYKM